jgi:presenilin-like A22 family membrane protease
MPCYISCALATIFVISSIFMTNMTQKNKIIQTYQSQLPSNLQNIYKKITDERQRIYYCGYALGLILSIIIIVYKNQKRFSMTNATMVCTVITVSFITNYFYYSLSPKSTYMLEHINSPEQTKAWLTMYKAMQYYWHAGLVLGIIATMFLALAFRC